MGSILSGVPQQLIEYRKVLAVPGSVHNELPVKRVTIQAEIKEARVGDTWSKRRGRARATPPCLLSFLFQGSNSSNSLLPPFPLLSFFFTLLFRTRQSSGLCAVATLVTSYRNTYHLDYLKTKSVASDNTSPSQHNNPTVIINP